MGRRKRRRVGPTHEWEQIELLCAWDEQVEYERIGPLVLFADRYGTAQLRLFESQDLLGDAGWLKALRLEGYAMRSRRRPEALQQALFPYLAAL